MRTTTRILVRAPNWIGDAVMARDFFWGLRESFPKAIICVVCPREMADLFQGELGGGICDEVLSLSRSERKFPSGAVFWKGLASRKFDLAVSLTSSLGSALLLRLSGAKERIAYADPLARFFLTRSLPWPGRAAGVHKSQLYRELLPLVGAAPTKRSALAARPKVKTGSVVLAPGASISLREWPGFVELAKKLRQIYPECVVRVVGSAAQQNWELQFQALEDPAVESFIGLTTLVELVELCREALFVVANDSGVAHVAATLAGAPTVVCFGPGDPHYVVPEGENVKVARVSGLACSPCESARCRGSFGYQACLKGLDVEEVLRQISALG